MTSSARPLLNRRLAAIRGGAAKNGSAARRSSRDVRAGHGDGLDQPRPGLPRPGRPRGDPRGGPYGRARRPRQTIPAGPGVPELRTAVAAHQSAATASSSTRTARPRHGRRPEAIGGRPARPRGTATRSFAPWKPYYLLRTRPAFRDGPAAPAPVTLRRQRRLRSTWTSCACRWSRPTTRLLLINTRTTRTGNRLTRGGAHRHRGPRRRRDLPGDHDEKVYEHLTFGDRRAHPARHAPPAFARAPSPSARRARRSRHRLKVGWVTASPELVTAVRFGQAFSPYVASAPFQYAVAEALALPDSYFRRLPPPTWAPRGPPRGRPHGAGVRRCSGRGHVLVTTDIRPLGGERRLRVLPRAARNARASSPIRTRCSTTTRHGRPLRYGFAFCKRSRYSRKRVGPPQEARALTRILTRALNARDPRVIQRDGPGPYPRAPVRHTLLLGRVARTTAAAGRVGGHVEVARSRRFFSAREEQPWSADAGVRQWRTRAPQDVRDPGAPRLGRACPWPSSGERSAHRRNVRGVRRGAQGWSRLVGGRPVTWRRRPGVAPGVRPRGPPLPPAGRPRAPAALDPLLSGLDRDTVPDLAECSAMWRGTSFGRCRRRHGRPARRTGSWSSERSLGTDTESVRFLHEWPVWSARRARPAQGVASRTSAPVGRRPEAQRILDTVRRSTGDWRRERRERGREAFLVIRLQRDGVARPGRPHPAGPVRATRGSRAADDRSCADGRARLGRHPRRPRGGTPCATTTAPSFVGVHPLPGHGEHAGGGLDPAEPFGNPQPGLGTAHRFTPPLAWTQGRQTQVSERMRRARSTGCGTRAGKYSEWRRGARAPVRNRCGIPTAGALRQVGAQSGICADDSGIVARRGNTGSAS